MAELAAPAPRAADAWAGASALEIAAAIAAGETSAREQFELAIARIEAGDAAVILMEIRSAHRARRDAQHRVGGIHDARIRHRFHPHVPRPVKRDRLHDVVVLPRSSSA